MVSSVIIARSVRSSQSRCGGSTSRRFPDIFSIVKGCPPLLRRRAMGNPEIGWIAAIIIGGIAGWLAEQFMKSNMGLLMNIVLGIVGAAIASAIFSFFGIALGGWIG